jgi:hypothetical protein
MILSPYKRKFESTINDTYVRLPEHKNISNIAQLKNLLITLNNKNQIFNIYKKILNIYGNDNNYYNDLTFITFGKKSVGKSYFNKILINILLNSSIFENAENKVFENDIGKLFFSDIKSTKTITIVKIIYSNEWQFKIKYKLLDEYICYENFNNLYINMKEEIEKCNINDKLEPIYIEIHGPIFDGINFTLIDMIGFTNNNIKNNEIIEFMNDIKNKYKFTTFIECIAINENPQNKINYFKSDISILTKCDIINDNEYIEYVEEYIKLNPKYVLSSSKMESEQLKKIYKNNNCGDNAIFNTIMNIFDDKFKEIIVYVINRNIDDYNNLKKEYEQSINIKSLQNEEIIKIKHYINKITSINESVLGEDKIYINDIQEYGNYKHQIYEKYTNIFTKLIEKKTSCKYYNDAAIKCDIIINDFINNNIKNIFYVNDTNAYTFFGMKNNGALKTLVRFLEDTIKDKVKMISHTLYLEMTNANIKNDKSNKELQEKIKLQIFKSAKSIEKYINILV